MYVFNISVLSYIWDSPGRVSPVCNWNISKQHVAPHRELSFLYILIYSFQQIPKQPMTIINNADSYHLHLRLFMAWKGVRVTFGLWSVTVLRFINFNCATLLQHMQKCTILKSEMFIFFISCVVLFVCLNHINVPV